MDPPCTQKGSFGPRRFDFPFLCPIATDNLAKLFISRHIRTMKRFPTLLATLCLIATAGTTLAKAPIKVYLLVGQSNMVGHGRIEEGKDGVNGAQGSLRHMVANNTKAYGHLLQDPEKTATSKWAVRDDVWVWHNNDGPEHGKLNVGFGRSTINIGPEFGFGHVIGKASDEQVLLIKACWGGKSLAKDFLPPSAAEYPAPKEPGDAGYYYQLMLKTYNDAIANLKKYFPDYDGGTIELAGIVWFQGYNDRFGGNHESYEVNLAHLIKDLRKEFKSPKLPFVIGETGNDGKPKEGSSAAGVMNAQKAVTDFKKYPAFRGNVAFVETTGFWRERDVSPTGGGHHWFGNGESYYLIGEAMGKAMVGLMEKTK